MELPCNGRASLVRRPDGCDGLRWFGTAQSSLGVGETLSFERMEMTRESISAPLQLRRFHDSR